MRRYICLVLSTLVFVKAAPSTHWYADYTKERYKRDEACLDQVKIDRQVINKAVTSLTFPADDQKYKEYLSCSYKKQGFQTNDGVIQFKAIKDFLTKFYDRTDLQSIDLCKSDDGKSHGDRAFEALECVVGRIRVLEPKSP